MNELIDTDTQREPTIPLLTGSRSYNQPSFSYSKGDSLELIKELQDESVNCILTDPPYKYLKNQKLEVDFNEEIFFNEAKRVLKKDGFIILFGRGASFYRWNTIISDLGFIFKEEIIWDKGYCTSPLMNMSRVHETISIHTKKSGTIRKVKVPYLEMKAHDISSIVQDIKRMRSVFTQAKSLDAVKQYLENNKRDTSDRWKSNNLSISSDITKEDRCVSVIRSMQDGMIEKSIVRTDFEKTNNFYKNEISGSKISAGDGDRCVKIINSIETGMNEKTIIKEARDHYSAIHPTQKPVRLLERLLALTTKKGDIVVDPFSGSCSTGEACINLNRKFIGYEIDEEYFIKSVERIKSIEPRLF